MACNCGAIQGETGGGPHAKWCSSQYVPHTCWECAGLYGQHAPNCMSSGALPKPGHVSSGGETMLKPLDENWERNVVTMLEVLIDAKVSPYKMLPTGAEVEIAKLKLVGLFKMLRESR